MRIKRLKTCKKHVSFYKNNFGFHEPYQILVDLTFCQTALTYKINIKEQVPKYIDGEIQLCTTKCILEEGKLLGPQLGGAVHICKQFKLRKCGHENGKAVSAQQCIMGMLGKENTKHFFVASQDKELRNAMRKIPGVPLLHINYNALVLEKPSHNSIKESQQMESTKAAPAAHEQIDQLKIENDIVEEKEERIKIKRRKNPNPLSIKKKKKKTKDSTATEGKSAKKRRRRKQKIATHVLEELRKSKDS